MKMSVFGKLTFLAHLLSIFNPFAKKKTNLLSFCNTKTKQMPDFLDRIHLHCYKDMT